MTGYSSNTKYQVKTSGFLKPCQIDMEDGTLADRMAETSYATC